MLITFRYRIINKFISVITLIAFLNLTQGCYYYKITTSKNPPDQALSQTQDQGKYIILHVGPTLWHLTNITASKDTINGEISNLVGHEKYKKSELMDVYSKRYKKSKRMDESEVLSEVHIFVTNVKRISDNQVSIPINSIKRIDIYGPDQGKTTASWIFSILGLTLLISIVIGTIAVYISWNYF